MARKRGAVTDAERIKRERRLERQREEAATRARAARVRRVRNASVVVVLLAAFAVILFLLFKPDPEVAGVERPANRGREHITATPQYDSAAPTSGGHPANAPPCGAVDQPIEPGLAVHALEHGAVVVWYQANADQALIEKLEVLLAEWESHWLLSPSAAIADPIVATAWNRRKSFDTADEDLREFVSTYRRRGPERFDCPA